MKAFEINLTNQTKAGWLALGFTVILTVALVSGIILLQGYGDVVTYAVLFGVGAGLLCGFAFLMKKVIVEPSLVTIADDRITVVAVAELGLSGSLSG